MCGLAGIISYCPDAHPVDREELLRIRDRMTSRGPDGAGLWLSPNQRVGLAHRRLAIIDLSDTGAQPMLDPDTGNRIVFNGEIYNYRQLRIELEKAGHHFHSTSDTEVLLKLYAEYGQEMLHNLRGMYAFGIWDEKEKSIFLARDPFGIKPLYIADDGKTLRFASQVKALLASGHVDTAPNPAGHVGFFLWGHVPDPHTLYRGARALPAGTSLSIDCAGRRKQNAFFDLAEFLRQAQSGNGSLALEEARERLHVALLDSVSHHLVSDVPVGVFLSAGLDSGSMAALVKQASMQELTTVTLGFREFIDTEDDEVPLAVAVARKYGATHHTHWVEKEDFAIRLNQMLDAMDQPSIDGVNSYFVSLAARQAGLKVVLSGLGGDELLGGYSDFQSIPRLVRAAGPLARIPGLGAGFRRVTAPFLKRFTSPKYAGLLEYGGDYAGAYLLRRGLFMPWELPELLDPDMVRAGWHDLQTLSALSQSIKGVKESRLKVSALETGWYMCNQLLRDTDWASMAHSLEVRVPLVDTELVRTVTQLVKAGHPLGKRDMAANLACPLPSDILQRRKTGFSVPVSDWLASCFDSSGSTAQRGLRGWANFLYMRQGFSGTGARQ